MLGQEEPKEVTGGQVWQPKKEVPVKTRSILNKVYASISILCIFGIIGMTILGFIQISTFPPQGKEVFVKVMPYTQGWEGYVLAAFAVTLFVSLGLWVGDVMISILISGMLSGILLIVAQAPALIATNTIQNIQVEEWLNQEQKLSFLNDNITVADLTKNKPILMEGNNGKTYAVTFKDVKGQVSIINKVEQK